MTGEPKLDRVGRVERVERVDHAGVRYAPSSRRGHVESYFLKANDPTGGRALWLKATIFAPPGAPEAAVAESWAVAFDRERGHVAAKSQVPFAAARFSAADVDVEVSGCSLRRDGARGALEHAGAKIAWDVRLASRGAPLVHFPRPWMYEGRFPSSKLVSPVFDGRLEGTVDVDGRRWEVSGWPALLGHNWGAGHAPSYAWAHCNAWDGGEDLALEGLSARVAIGPLASPAATLLFVRHRGVDYALNGAREWATNRGAIGARRWVFHGKSAAKGAASAEIDGELWAAPDDLVGLYYPNPSGPMTYCLNTKLARARVTLRLSGRPAFTVTSRAAALEIGTRDPRHGTRMYV